MTRNPAVFAAMILGVAIFSGFPERLGGQAEEPQSPPGASPSLQNERDVKAQKTALTNDSSDLEAMSQSLNGTEFRATIDIDTKAQEGVLELDATLWFLGIYDSMQCAPDREIAKAALKERLAFYSHVLDVEAGIVASNLPYTTSPATAQSGARVKDDLRAAKSKLDEIAASLN